MGHPKNYIRPKSLIILSYAYILNESYPQFFLLARVTLNKRKEGAKWSK